MPLPRAVRVIKKRLRPISRRLKPLTALINARRTAASLAPPRSPYDGWLAVNHPTAFADQDLGDALQLQGPSAPRLSIIMPVYRPPLPLLQEAIASVQGQILEAWELCIADDGGRDPDVEIWLQQLAIEEPRVRLVTLPNNQGIASATNAAASLSTAEVLVFLDQDDLLHPHCLAELALYYAAHPDADLVYTDHDKIDATGRRYDPSFKPAWSPSLLLSHMYLGHTVSLKRELFQALDGVRPGFEGAQDFDLALRATERARHVGHIPKILYHWRALEGSTALSGDAKPASFEAGRRAVTEAIQRRGIVADVLQPKWAKDLRLGLFGLRFPESGPRVDVLIPEFGSRKQAYSSLKAWADTAYHPANFVLADDGTIPDLSLLCQRTLDDRFQLVRVAASDGTPSRLNALAAASASPLIALANGVVTPLDPSWLTEMVGYLSTGAASVGGQQRDEKRVIESGLLIDGAGDAPQPLFRGQSCENPGYSYLTRVARECSAPSSRLLLVNRASFDKVGLLNCATSDRCLIDLALRLERPGVVSPNSAFRCGTRLATPLRRATILPLDPFHNRNLARSGKLFSIRPVAKQIHSSRPIRTIFFSHNLRNEGAPRTLTDLAIGLHKKRATESIVVSWEDGPCGKACRAAGIRTIILPGRSIDGLVQLLKDVRPEVLLASSLQSLQALEAAMEAPTPTILWQHESEAWNSYFQAMPGAARAQAYRLLRNAYRTTYVSETTRQLWARVTGANSAFIPNTLPPEASASIAERSQARLCLGVPHDETLFLLPGTVCRRKGQIDAVKAFGCLPINTIRRASLVIAGAHPEVDYIGALRVELGRLDLEVSRRILLTGAVPDMEPWLAACDVVLCTSRLESAPRTILEAMAHRRPIISTPVYGIPEMLPSDSMALFYKPSRFRRLAQHLQRLAQDPSSGIILAESAHREFKARLSFNNVLDEYGELIREAAGSSPINDAERDRGGDLSFPGRSRGSHREAS